MQLLDLCISDEMISNENLNTLLQISEYLKISRTFSVSKSKINFFFFGKINSFRNVQVVLMLLLLIL